MPFVTAWLPMLVSFGAQAQTTQPVAHSLEELRRLVKEGDTISVTQDTGQWDHLKQLKHGERINVRLASGQSYEGEYQSATDDTIMVRVADRDLGLYKRSVVAISGETKGKLVRLTPASLTLMVDGKEQQMDECSVLEVRREHGSAGKGALIGLGVGAATGYVLQGNSAYVPRGFLAGLFGGIGTGIGAIAGALSKSQTVVYHRAPQRPPAAVAIVPILSATRKAMMVSVRF